MYPAGRQIWWYHQDDIVCGTNNLPLEPGWGITRLHLSACSKDEFGCDDGSCISIDNWCDLNNDCLDQSDEKNCSILIKPDWYVSKIAPPKFNNHQKNKIWINLRIFEILDINILDTSIKSQFRLKTSWYDPRLTFKNLKTEEHKNSVSSSENIWVPTLCFHNTESKLSTILDSKTKITVKREGPLTYSPPDVVENTHYYKGSENLLSMRRTYDISFICNYDIGMYPFDTQICHFNISMCLHEDQHISELIPPENIQFLGSEDFAEYNYVETAVTKETFRDGMVGISVKLVFQRKIFSLFMTIYIPTNLIVFVSYLTTFFNNKQWFGHIITINLTVTTLTIS